MKQLRNISNAEKLAYYFQKGDRPELYTHVESDGTERPYTREEWEDLILNHRRHPDIDEVDLSYIGKRREQYPDETEQLDTIWKILKHLKENGVDLGPHGSMVDDIFGVKDRFRKPSGL